MRTVRFSVSMRVTVENDDELPKQRVIEMNPSIAYVGQAVHDEIIGNRDFAVLLASQMMREMLPHVDVLAMQVPEAIVDALTNSI